MNTEVRKFGLVIAIAVTLFACTSDSVSDLVAIDNDSPVTFVANVAPIISSSCMPCHGNPPTNGAPQTLISFDEVVNSVENEGLLGRINSVSNPMPPSGLLAEPIRQIIEDWVDDGLLEE